MPKAQNIAQLALRDVANQIALIQQRYAVTKAVESELDALILEIERIIERIQPKIDEGE